MRKPNLFTYATSELSQDAIICWLLEWGKLENKDINKELHQVSILFLNSLFDKFHDIETPKQYNSIKIYKQYKNIDVFCVINNEYAIIIEDKTDTKNHSGQLEKYFEQINKKFDKSKILPIYFKTGDQSNYAKVLDKGYKTYLRKDILAILDNPFKNDVLQDYKSYLQKIEDNIHSYKNLSLGLWTRSAIKGFYIALQKELGDGNWDYVANPTGGFLGFWWYFKGTDECKQYLQIESDSHKTILCIKISVKHKEDRKRLRTHWYKIIKKKSDELNFNFVKPSRFGSGNYMTILVLKDDFRKVNNNNIIDMKSTAKYLNTVKSLIDSVQ